MTRDELTADRFLVRRGGKPRIVHVSRRVQCEHDDCREHPELAAECWRATTRVVVFGEEPPEHRAIALCGFGSIGTTREPLVEPSRWFADGFLATLRLIACRDEPGRIAFAYQRHRGLHPSRLCNTCMRSGEHLFAAWVARTERCNECQARSPWIPPCEACGGRGWVEAGSQGPAREPVRYDLEIPRPIFTARIVR